jgi:hypothetical protein
MICRFCHQDVPEPCRDAEQLRERAMRDVERCAKALEDELTDGIQPSDGQSAGSV